MSKALKQQVSGTHYLTMKIQPAEMCLANMTEEQLRGVLIWMNMKYVWREKDDFITDYKKARHYIDMIVEELENRQS